MRATAVCWIKLKRGVRTQTSICSVFQGMLTLVSNCIDRLNLYNSAAHFGESAGEEAAAAWKDILNLLYELLGKRGGALWHLSPQCPCDRHADGSPAAINHRGPGATPPRKSKSVARSEPTATQAGAGTAAWVT